MAIDGSKYNYQEVLAKCFVAMSEIEYDLEQWRISLVYIELVGDYYAKSNGHVTSSTSKLPENKP